LSRTDDLQQIDISTEFLTVPRQLEFKATYPQLKFTEVNEKVTVNIAQMSDGDAVSFLADLLFLKMNPLTPLENQSASLVNYLPQDESQKTALEFAKKLVEYSGRRASGLFMSGTTGIGKTHISIAVAKEFLKKGEHPLFVGPKTNLSPEQIQGHSIFIFDDLNSGYGDGVQSFIDVVSRVHDLGGKIFVTSNTGFKKLFDQMAGKHSIHSAEGPRLLDRIKTMFKFLELKGKSYRSKDAWFNEGT